MDKNQTEYSLKCIAAIQQASTILKINMPEIYFINVTSSRIELYNQNLEFISEDFRDIGYKIDKIRFIPKEYVIYINTKIFENEVSMLCHCYQTIRYVYQIEEVRKYKKGIQYNDTESNLRQWNHCFNTKVKGVDKTKSPICLDMMAFAKLILFYFHSIDISFKGIDQKSFETAVNYIKESTVFKEIRKVSIKK